MSVIVIRTGNCQTGSHTTLNYSDLMNLVLSGKVEGSDSVTGLMVSSNTLIVVSNEAGFFLRTGNDLHGSLFNISLSNSHSAVSCSEKSSFIQEIFKISACESLSSLSDDLKINIRTQGFIFSMNFEDLLTSLNIRITDNDLSVESSRSEQSWVEDITAVGGSDNDNAFVACETVHFNEQLVKCLFTFIVTAAETGTSVTADSIDLVDENNSRGVFFSLFKEITDTGSAHTNEHFHKVRT